MPIKELRDHLAHTYAEYDSWCGYCWLESEACAGEPGGGGYDYYVPLTAGAGGEYAEEPAYHNPFALTGAIGGLTYTPSDAERFAYYQRDIMISLSIHRPVDMIIVTGIS